VFCWNADTSNIEFFFPNCHFSTFLIHRKIRYK
jgi:hypothetical protein